MPTIVRILFEIWIFFKFLEYFSMHWTEGTWNVTTQEIKEAGLKINGVSDQVQCYTEMIQMLLNSLIVTPRWNPKVGKSCI